MDRLQTVADIGKGASDDHAHRVIEIRALHLVFDIDWDQVFVIAGWKQHASTRSVLLGQKRTPRGLRLRFRRQVIVKLGT